MRPLQSRGHNYRLLIQYGGFREVRSKLANACSYALAKFELGGFKEKQSKALKELTLGRNAFVILPTGSGKSLIFQAFPILLDHMESRR